MNDKTIQLWEVSLWPNNQSPILLGEYYARNAKDAMKIASLEREMPVDENFCAELAGENSPINRWRKH